MKNSPTKFAEPGIASGASVTTRNSVASTGARKAIPPISRMSSEPARSARTTKISISGTITRPWLTVCSSAPSAPSRRRAKMPSVMKPSWATDE